MLDAIAVTTVLAAAEGGGGNQLVAPNTGVMIWTLIAFLLTLFILKKFAYPAISDGLDKRQRAIEDAIDSAEQTKQEADQLLVEYRARLTEARQQADEIVAKAQRAGEAEHAESLEKARQQREDLVAQAHRDIQSATTKAVQDLRKEVADLTVTATEKVTRRALTAEDQQRLVGEALDELDFSALGDQSRN